MLILRIRQAQIAVRDGRLDEAFELCQSQRLRSHRRGQDLVTRLMDAYVKRGHEHLAGARPQQALIDCEKASKLGGENLPEVVELRAIATDAISARQRSERQHAQALHAARAAIEAGRLASGQQWLAQAGDESRARLLLRDVNAKRSMLEANLESAQSAFARGDLDVAASELAKARATDATDAAVSELCQRVCKAMKQRVASAFNEGRLDLAESLVQQLAKLQDDGVEAQQVQRAVDQSKLAWQAVDRGEPHRAEELLRRLANLLPDAKWIKEALNLASQAEEAMQALRGGPLGLLGSVRMQDRTTMTHSRDTGIQPAPSTPHGQQARVTGDASAELPSRFVIQVDGAGSFVVVRQPLVTLGPVSSSKVPDIGLIAEPGAPVISIERKEDDYFIRATGPISVNEKALSNKLLARGDRIAISPRCRLTFNLPNPASTTATIDLAGGRFPRADVRRVILLDRDIVLGPGNGTHVRVDQLSGNVLLIVRDNRLFVQSESMVTVDGKTMDRAAGIPLGAHVELGGVSFVVTRG